MYIFKDRDLKSNFFTLIWICILSGIFGFIYEMIFYRIDLGYFVKRGSSFGPWIPMYAFGGLLITILTYRFKDKPLKVFLYSLILAGILEYVVGFLLDKYMNLRLWNYNVEIWNFGNINGYICLRSILFFGISGLILIYSLIPFILKVTSKIPKGTFRTISIIIFIVYCVDIISYAIINYLA